MPKQEIILYNTKIILKNTNLKHTYIHMVFDIIMNNPGRYKYMSKSKDTVSVCFINLGGKETYINIYPIFYVCAVAGKKHQ